MSYIYRRSLSIIAVAVFVFSGVAFAEFGGDEYIIKALHSSKCLDVAWFSQANGGDVVQAQCTGTENQIWKAYFYSINSPTIFVAKHSNKALDVLNQSTVHAADVIQWDYSGFTGPAVRKSQWWNVYYAKTINGIPYYWIYNVNSNRCLDVAWFSQVNGGNVLQATCSFPNATDNQLWDIYNIQSGRHGTW